MSRGTFRDYKRLIRGANQFLQLLHCDCINGYALGKKQTSGKQLDELAITVFVNRKMALRRLPIANRIPKVLRIPDDRASGGVLEFITDVQEARFASLEYTERMRPAKSGISIGHVDITAGTLGGLFKDKVTGEVVILSNNHVLANSNHAAIGDAILQPGAHDGGVDPDDRLAELLRFVPIDFDEGNENLVDAAIAMPLSSSDVLWATVEVGAEVPREARHLGDSDLGVYVHKTGRTTGHTQGFVQAVYATVRVKFDLFQKATFVDQIIISQSPAEEDFSNGGDSGSLIYDSNNKCIGLLFAGSEGSEETPATTIANPISAVMRALNLEFLQPGEHPSSTTVRRRAS
ncbi:MAG TPA: hypothetical protein PKD54_02925, partial [Pirellulaceae bacterium]|nr:hypothetical protein [Pirellulaceae bacterium]